jgi:hypothetical protein
MRADDSVNHLFSGTNWVLGAPVWNDGNDLHDLNSVDRAFLRDSGWVMAPLYRNAIYAGPQGTLDPDSSAVRVGGRRTGPNGEKVSVELPPVRVMGGVFDVIVSDNAAQRRNRLDPTQYPPR